MLVFYLAAIDNDESKNKFEYIYHKYYRFMLRTASSIIRDSSLAEDAVHETFVQLLKEIDSLRIDNEKSLQSYLYILTRERTIDFLRKWERRRGVLTDYENRSSSFDNFKEPEEIALTNLQLNKAVSILSDMPSIYRRTLVLRVRVTLSVRSRKSQIRVNQTLKPVYTGRAPFYLNRSTPNTKIFLISVYICR